MAAKKTKKIKKSKSPEYQFVTAYLQKKRTASFAEIRDAAAKKRLKIYPIVFGRAQAQLGIVKSAPRGSKKAVKKTRASKIARRGPGRPRKTVSASDSLESLLRATKQTETELARCKRALQQIAAILDDVI